MMKKQSIEEVVILYNPNSTGDSLKNARQLRRDLREAGFKNPITLTGTKYPRHAEKLAHKYARASKHILLVSSSGDGGYHEVINGVLAGAPSHVITGLLPSGNANDHYHAMGEDSIVDSIINGVPRKVDVIQVTSRIGGKDWVRYAHSYVGIGISPAIGRELNKHDLNPINEKVILVQKLLSFKDIKILKGGRRTKVSSLVCANIPRMSKALKMAQDSAPDDGKFEVTIVRSRSRFSLFKALFTAATIGLEEKESTSEYSFDSIKRLPIQLDGEIYIIDPGVTVSVRSMKQRLSILI